MEEASGGAPPAGSFFSWLREREAQQLQAEAQQLQAAAPQHPREGEEASKQGFFSWLRTRQEDDAIWKCSWDVPASSLERRKDRDEHEPILVFDLGAYHLRAHVAERGGEGEEQSSILPSCVRRPWSGDGGYLSGCERGAVQNWEEVEDVLVDTLENHMSLGTGRRTDGVKRFLACVSSLRSPAHFARLGEIVFELLDAQQFLSVDQDLLSALAICGCSSAWRVSGEDPFAAAAGRLCRQMQNFTGVVIDVGSSVSRISPLLSGLAISGVVVELPLGGRDLDLLIRDDLLAQNERLERRSRNEDGVQGRPGRSGSTVDHCDFFRAAESTQASRREAAHWNVVSLTAARQGKEQLVYCVEDPAASDSGSYAVLQAETAFCAAHPASYEVRLRRRDCRQSVDADSTAFKTGQRRSSTPLVPPESSSSRFPSSSLSSSSLSSPSSSSPSSALFSFPPQTQASLLREVQMSEGISSNAKRECASRCISPLASLETGEVMHAGGRHLNCLTASRVQASELFFDKPFLADYRRRHHRGGMDKLDGDTLPEALLEAVERCPLDLKRELLENIYLVGGSSLIPGFAARLQAEVTNHLRRQKAHCSILPRVHVMPSPLQLHSVVSGGFRFALGPQFDLNHINRQQYEEYGTSFLERFSVRGRLR
ncbi:actin-like family protein [Toxoplasma gondii ME49]|uniref:Actin-like family protein n=6 Tax=Toxoplasma gondii TaxID=5811 RepID=A0A086KNM8_TOXGO|nr:actin-like family protein [Toxoplasma gondii ME49]EPT26769.1 actin-like family protein [Toxoplasma gondii ME49]KFG45996.1 actin-like family protein [Toxoplasma gondii GAB2-2007-GAL-DOM2]|eukprot:XP_018635848.1 actin-like family protein [Toxoplasma gondii ME49]